MNRRVHLNAHSAVRFRKLLAVSASLSALALSACSSVHRDDKALEHPLAPASSSKVATASMDPDAAEKTAVLKTYSSFWAEQVKAYARADIQGTDLKKYATEKALGQAMGDVLVMKNGGTVTTGAPKHRARITQLTLAGNTPEAVVQDCLDISAWKTVNRRSGKVQPFPSDQPLRYLTTAKTEKWGSRWMVTEVTPDGDHTC
ncbi:hypothetical protein ABZ527_31540 [Streptomyces griseofuscus]|uniref:hypothetical protein n=1 Tax=Streptomyces griseofuscus TaxID=146922 RepID=UPI0033DD7DF1